MRRLGLFVACFGLVVSPLTSVRAQSSGVCEGWITTMPYPPNPMDEAAAAINVEWGEMQTGPSEYCPEGGVPNRWFNVNRADRTTFRGVRVSGSSTEGGTPRGFHTNVTPDGGSAAVGGGSTGNSVSFTVSNTSGDWESYDLTCSKSGLATSCTPGSSWVSVGPYSSTNVSVSFAVNPGPGSAAVSLTATSQIIPLCEDPFDCPLEEDSGYYNLTVNGPTITIAGPGTTVYTRAPLVLARYSGPGAGVDTTTVVVKWGGVDVTSLGRFNKGLFEWEVDGATHELAPGGTKQLYVYACVAGYGCSVATRNVTLVSSPRPVLSVKTMPLEALGRQERRPFGPWTVSPTGVEASFSTPAYYTFNAPRTAGLTYASRQSYPAAFVNVQLEFPGGQPSWVTMRLMDGGVERSAYTQYDPSCSSSGIPVCLAAFRVEYTGITSGDEVVRKWLRIEAQANVGGSVTTSIDSVEVVLVDRRTTPYGSGWWPSGVMRLVVAGEDGIVVASDGTAAVYRGYQGRFISPPGSSVSLVAVTGGHELRFRGGGKVTFDSQGRQTSIVDAVGNTTTISYFSTTSRVYRITDPAGKYFEYVYDGSDKILRIQDFGGRQTTVTRSGVQLTSVTLPSPAGRTYRTRYTWNSYTGSAVLPVGMISETNDTTRLTWSANLPWQVVLPRATVVDAGGTSFDTIPDYEYHPGRQWYAVGSLLSYDHWWARTRLYDAKDQWMAVTHNRWGDPTWVYDALGTVSRATYDAAGRVLSAEGKVADSTRVHSTYDVHGRLVRVHKILPGGGVLRLDSIIYDANHRPIKRVDPEGRVTETVYDANGNVIRTIAPNGATAHAWYGAYGQVDSTRGPNATKATRFTYDANWRNTDQVLGPGGALISDDSFDSFGRVSQSWSKVTVAVSSTGSEMQWRRRVRFYNVANQVDSAYSQRTNNCAAPCTYQPGWPQATDTLRSVTARTIFNSLGADSIRQVGTGLPETFRYDPLGRLVQHWPRGRSVLSGMIASDTLSVVYRYDVLGNLRYALTRRGHTLETRFDSRNRPIQRILGSTVGTYDFTYAGPNDELTAIAAQSGFADPVGGSTIGASWVYNQSGQLVSETTQGNRTTTYAYSAALLRLTSLTDAIGTRNVRYDAATGAADSMSDPTDGWIRYTFGTDGRVHGPWVDGTGEAFSRTQNWKQSTGMSSVTNAHGYEVGKWSSSIFEEDDTLTTKWAEIRGSGNPTIEMPDSITYDGWERVTAIKHLKDGQLVASESFAFDGRGNLTIDSGATAFNVMDRLTASPGCTSISYDPAGNLTGRTCGGVSWSYTYDALDRLTNVSNSGGLSAAYTYDVLGNRIAKKVNAALVRFVWRSGHLVYETSGAGTIKYSYQWGYSTDDLIAIHDHATGAHFYVVQDQLRSLRGLVNRNGAWAASWRYRAYGAPLDSAGSALNAYRRFRWAGAQYDEETGFYFLRTRYYDPTIGRFVQEDKIGHAGGANLYMYVGGGPLDARDPTGTAKIYDTHFTFLPNCWNVFECRDGFHALDPYGRDGGGYQSVSSIPPGFFSNAVVSVLNYGLAQMIAMDVHRAANPTGRPMTDAERAAVGNACDQVKCDRVRITEGNQFARGFTIGYGIYINGTLDMTLHAAKFLLAHELWHVYQWQTRGSLWYTWYGLGSFVSRAAFWRSPYSLPVGGPGSTNIWDYGFEQQGNIVASCVTNPLSAWCKVSPWY